MITMPYNCSSHRCSSQPTQTSGTPQAHPRAIAAFGRECTRRGVPPATASLFGSQFITWRGVPLIPSDKIPLEEGRTKILLLRVGEERQGVVGLYQPGLTGDTGPAGQRPPRRHARRGRDNHRPPRERQAACTGTIGAEQHPDSLEEAGFTVHPPPRREAGPGWDPLTPVAAAPAGPARVLADPYAPLRAQQFYFADPARLSRTSAPVTRRPGGPRRAGDVQHACGGGPAGSYLAPSRHPAHPVTCGSLVPLVRGPRTLPAEPGFTDFSYR